jgi:hypothetical protein
MVGGAVPAVTRVNRLSWRLQQASQGRSNGESITLSSLTHLEAPPTWIRLIYYIDPAAPWTVDGAAVATTSSVGDGVSPTDETGIRNDGLWRQVTFNNKGRDTDPLKQSGGDAVSFVMPHDLGPIDLTVSQLIILSDWVPVAPMRRVDGGLGNLLLARTYSQGQVRLCGGLGPPDPAMARIHAGFWSPGNGTRAPWTFSPRKFDAAYAAFGLQYICAAAGATVAGIGDSIMQGMGSTSAVSGFGARACAMISTPHFPVSYFSEGYIGRRSEEFLRYGVWVIEKLRPQIALIQTWSENDAKTQAAADTAFECAIAVADCANRNGCVAILVTAADVAFAEIADRKMRS